LGVFEFIVVLVLITTGAKVIERRRGRDLVRGDSLRVDTEELHRLRDTIGDLSGRVELLEQERDFFKDLLEPRPERPQLPLTDTEESM